MPPTVWIPDRVCNHTIVKEEWLPREDWLFKASLLPIVRPPVPPGSQPRVFRGPELTRYMETLQLRWCPRQQAYLYPWCERMRW